MSSIAAAMVAAAAVRSVGASTSGRILGILEIIGLWMVFVKAGERGWKAIIPFWNLYILCKITGRPAWWVILAIIPIVNLAWIVFSLLISLDLARDFGKGGGFGVGLWLLGFIFYPILGFGAGHLCAPAGTTGVRHAVPAAAAAVRPAGRSARPAAAVRSAGRFAGRAGRAAVGSGRHAAAVVRPAGSPGRSPAAVPGRIRRQHPRRRRHRPPPAASPPPLLRQRRCRAPQSAAAQRRAAPLLRPRRRRRPPAAPRHPRQSRRPATEPPPAPAPAPPAPPSDVAPPAPPSPPAPPKPEG